MGLPLPLPIGTRPAYGWTTDDAPITDRQADTDIARRRTAEDDTVVNRSGRDDYDRAGRARRPRDADAER